MPYNNPQYWTNLHNSYKGELRAVGHPFLSENLNLLKYESEGNSMSQVLSKVANVFGQKGIREFSFLDVGAGTGYWTGFVFDGFSRSFMANATALDISAEALDILSEQFPDVKLVKEDLTKIETDKFLESYDLVFSCYCLHHLVNLDDFVNALRFVGNSVKKGGFLLIMDPILTMPYSKYDTIDFDSFHGNGIPRHLYMIDDILSKVGLQRQVKQPAASFILNENVEARGSIVYFLMTVMWKILCKFYRSERFVQIFGGILKQVDKKLKRLSLSFSSSICLYQKI